MLKLFCNINKYISQHQEVDDIHPKDSTDEEVRKALSPTFVFVLFMKM